MCPTSTAHWCSFLHDVGISLSTTQPNQAKKELTKKQLETREIQSSQNARGESPHPVTPKAPSPSVSARNSSAWAHDFARVFSFEVPKGLEEINRVILKYTEHTIVSKMCHFNIMLKYSLGLHTGCFCWFSQCPKPKLTWLSTRLPTRASFLHQWQGI